MAQMAIDPTQPVTADELVHPPGMPRRAIASAQDERILNEKRRHRDQPFDVQPVRTGTLDDLDLRFFEKTYLPAAFAPDVRGKGDELSRCRHSFGLGH